MKKFWKDVKNANTESDTEVRDELWALEKIVTNIKEEVTEDTAVEIDQAIQILIKTLAQK